MVYTVKMIPELICSLSSENMEIFLQYKDINLLNYIYIFGLVGLALYSQFMLNQENVVSSVFSSETGGF